MPRTVIVGDLHGCRAELETLLARVAFGAGDRLVAVGDLVARGPDPGGVIDLLVSVGGRAVRGNHEDRLLRHRARAGLDGSKATPGDEPGDRPLGSAHRAVVDALAPRHWAYLASLPLWIDLPDLGVRVVHAGVVPGVLIEKQKPRTLMYVRCLGPTGKPVEQRGAALWGARYEGPPHVLFGHNALPEPQIHRHATGIDTGCVYGNRLTAMVLPDGAGPPAREDRQSALVSVPARRAYADV